MKILVVTEQRQGKWTNASFETLAAAQQMPEVRAVATIAAPADPAHVIGLFRQHVADIH